MRRERRHHYPSTTPSRRSATSTLPPRKPPPRRDAGATQDRSRIRARLHSWLAHHRQTALDSLQRLLATPSASAMTWLVIGIALALPAALFVALQNLEDVSRGWDGAAQMSLFMEPFVSDAEGQALAERLVQRPDVLATRFITAEQALAEFRALSGLGEVLDGLEDNPLPAVIGVRPREEGTDVAMIEQLFDELNALPEVNQAVLDLAWVQRLYSLMELGRRLTLTLALLLSLGVLLIIGNTIRLSIESRREEVLIVKLVGGTDAFVRRPFLYTGLWYGLGGGLLAWLIVSTAVLWLGPASTRLADLYNSHFTLAGLDLGNAAALWMTGALLGWLGAWLAVGRHLSEIEPQ